MAAVAVSAAATPLPAHADEPGSLYHYVRSNQDGSMAENIVMFRPAPDRMAVYKWVEKCTGAAYVTAEVDPATGEAKTLYAGRVGQDGSQRVIGRMDFDPTAMTLSARIDLPDGPVVLTTPVSERPWHLFDYDLATLAVAFAADPAPKERTIGLALAWPGEGGLALRWLGAATLNPAGSEDHMGRKTIRYEAVGPAFAGKGGPLWVDAVTGALVDVQWGLPNHPGYDDFRLRLDRVEPGGQAAWDRLLAAHYADCEEG